jgi:hypothetical protein
MVRDQHGARGPVGELVGSAERRQTSVLVAPGLVIETTPPELVAWFDLGPAALTSFDLVELAKP